MRSKGAAPLILLVEDDAALVELIRYNLEAAGFAVISCSNGEEALLYAEEQAPALVILDWMIEGISGIEVCRRLRRKTSTALLPVIILTARAEESDRIRGLETGADDYITKPFSPRELLARVRSVLRRANPGMAGEILQQGGVVMDTTAHKVTREGRAIHLGPTEFRLLRHLLERPGRVFSREQLLDAAWGRDSEVEQRTVDVHIRRLRMALDIDGLPDLVRTVRSAGYAFEPASANQTGN